MRKLLLIVLAVLHSGCTGIPEGVEPVGNFQVARYLGTWYEIARLDHAFERNLTQVTAEYSPRPEGGLRVINRGFDPETSSWKTAAGKAYFAGSENIAHLKVSFFGPFYGSYIVARLDQTAYQYAFVASHSRRYLWLLARTPQVAAEVRQEFLQFAKNHDFNTEELTFVDQPTTRP